MARPCVKARRRQAARAARSVSCWSARRTTACRSASTRSCATGGRRSVEGLAKGQDVLGTKSDNLRRGHGRCRHYRRAGLPDRMAGALGANAASGGRRCRRAGAIAAVVRIHAGLAAPCRDRGVRHLADFQRPAMGVGRDVRRLALGYACDHLRRRDGRSRRHRARRLLRLHAGAVDADRCGAAAGRVSRGESATTAPAAAATTAAPRDSRPHRPRGRDRAAVLDRARAGRPVRADRAADLSREPRRGAGARRSTRRRAPGARRARPRRRANGCCATCWCFCCCSRSSTCGAWPSPRPMPRVSGTSSTWSCSLPRSGSSTAPPRAAAFSSATDTSSSFLCCS